MSLIIKFVYYHKIYFISGLMVMTDRLIQEFFGERLRQARSARSMSQAGLAQRLDTGQDTISDYERGKTRPPVDMIWRMACVLQVNVDYFFPYERFHDIRADDQATLSLLATLSPVMQSYFLRLIPALMELQQRRQFLPPDASTPEAVTPQIGQALLSGLERDWHTFEMSLKTPTQPGCPFLNALVSYTARLVMTLETPHPKLEREALMQCLLASSQQLIHLLVDLKTREDGT
jgi:transcriptional regulator with XRE-family HTH domain